MQSCIGVASQTPTKLFSILVMYGAVSRCHFNNTTYLSIMTGYVGAQVDGWMRDDPSIPNTVTYINLPTLAMVMDQPMMFTNVYWVVTSVRLDKRPRRWGWSNSPSKMPPVFHPIYRDYNMVVTQYPHYFCRGFDRFFEPKLEMIPFNRDNQRPPFEISLPCNVFKLADVLPELTMVSYITRVFPHRRQQDGDEDKDGGGNRQHSWKAAGFDEEVGASSN